jgi:outer membrane lipoprotein carrier protein
MTMLMYSPRSVFSVLSAALAALAFLLTWAPLHGAETVSSAATPEARAETLQNLYRGLTSLTFDFSQVTSSGGRERTGSGNGVFYKAPAPRSGTGSSERLTKEISIMRWNYTEPDRQIIINDGENLSIYTEKDRQLIKTPASELESDITFAIFAGTRALLDDFEARDADSSTTMHSSVDSYLRTVLLVPREPHNQIKTVQVWFDEKGIIHHLRIEDHFAATTDLHFDNIELNGLPPYDREQADLIISLQVPPDTEIITQ